MVHIELRTVVIRANRGERVLFLPHTNIWFTMWREIVKFVSFSSHNPFPSHMELLCCTKMLPIRMWLYRRIELLIV